MRDVDRVAVDEFGLSLLGTMENAGRNPAWHIREMRSGPVVVLAGNGGNGGNGGGGLCAARHLANRDVPVSVVLDRDPERLDGAARKQSEILAATGVPVTVGVGTLAEWDPETVVDALVGYGLDGARRGSAAGLVDAVADSRAQVVSLDVPSGMVATTGERPEAAIEPDRVVTLALPKTGLADTRCDLYLADIGIPAGVYHALDIPYSGPFDDGYWTPLTRPET